MSGDTERAVEAGLRALSDEASPDWTLTDGSRIGWMVREGPRGAQIGNFICREDAEFAVAAVAYVRFLASSRPAAPDSPDQLREALTDVLGIVEETSGSLPSLDRAAVERIVRKALSPSPGSTSGSRDSEAGR